MKPKIVFFGSPEFSCGFLESLLEDYEIVLVVTAPDKPQAHGRNRTSAIKKFALDRNLTVMSPEKLDLATIKKISHTGAELAVVVAYGKIIPANLIHTFSLGMINVHGSILPKHRGASPIEAAILSGDKQTGPTIMLIEPELDSGPILSQHKFNIIGLDQAKVYQKMSSVGRSLLVKTLKDYLNGKIKPKPQNNKLATYSKKINKSDGLLDSSKPAVQLYRQILAYKNWPTSFFYYRNKIVTVLEASIAEDFGRTPGELFARGSQLLLACQGSSLHIHRLKTENKKAVNSVDFINANQEINRI